MVRSAGLDHVSLRVVDLLKSERDIDVRRVSGESRDSQDNFKSGKNRSLHKVSFCRPNVAG